jgi:hypothetical protein
MCQFQATECVIDVARVDFGVHPGDQVRSSPKRFRMQGPCTLLVGPLTSWGKRYHAPIITDASAWLALLGTFAPEPFLEYYLRP